MMKKAKFALLALFVAAIFAGPAMAATINEDATLTGYTPFNIAYEVYNNSTGVNANNVPIFIHNTGTILSGDSINLRVINGKVNLSGQNVFLTAPVDQIGFAGAACTVALPLTGEVVIGESIAGAVPSADISINIYDGARFCLRNNLTGGGSAITVSAGAATYVGAGLGRVETNDVATVVLQDALNFFVVEALNPTCTTPKYVQLAYVANNETADYKNILVITPQFTVSNHFYKGVKATLNAELDTDFDFTQFIAESGPMVWNYGSDSGQLFQINNLQAQDDTRWRAWVAQTNVGSYSFTLNSANPETGISIWTHDATSGNVACVANGTSTAWTCGLSGQLIGDFTTPSTSSGKTSVVIHNTAYTAGYGLGTVELNPTVWTITDALISVTYSGQSKEICQVPSGQVGVWFGGLEAIVPFVKGDTANGYETYIKLFNRYTKDAKLYVATFKDGVNGPTIVSTTQIVGKEVIPAQSATNPNGALLLNSADIASICPTCDMAAGIPVKFLIRVPGQKGYAVTEGEVSGDIYLYDDDDYFDGSFNGYVDNYNQLDPYVEGIVMSQYPGGMRNVPLKFRYFMNGEYNQ